MLSPAIEAAASPRALDCTLGGGGHSEELLAAHPELFLVGIDRDPAAVARSAARLAPFAPRTHLQHGYFGDLPAVLAALPVEVCRRLSPAGGGPAFDAILLDAGISSDQLDDPSRGFSFSRPGPLDMRMSIGASDEPALTAADILNNYSLSDLARVFRRGGVGADSLPLARAIVARRPIADSQVFQSICESVIGRAAKKKSKRRGEARRQNPATVPFQALRIEVNDEFNQLDDFFSAAVELLGPGGRLAVISFHSLEDEITAKHMRRWSRAAVDPRLLPPTVRQEGIGRLLTRQAIVPGEDEVAANPRSRSARLRVFEKQPNQITEN